MKKNFIVAIDLGGTNLKVALLNSRYRILHKEILPTGNFIHKQDLIKGIVCAVKNILKSNRLCAKNILGLGVGVPGPVDIEAGRVYFLPNIPGWRDVPLKNILNKILGMPVVVDNDAKLMCLAEHRLGAAKNTRNALCITLGTGVGGGLIIGGKLYRGSSGAAGEIGHLPINEGGARCNCGNRGCLETYIGNRNIMRQAKKVFKQLKSPEELSRLAEQGNQKALALWSGVGEHLGNALVGAVNILNPDCIVVGGGVSAAGKVLLDRVRRVVRKRAMSVQAKKVKILRAKLGNDAGLVGAAILVKEISS